MTRPAGMCRGIPRNGRCPFFGITTRGDHPVCGTHSHVYDEWADAINETAAHARVFEGRDANGIPHIAALLTNAGYTEALPGAHA